jgi:hypothetical protein
MADRVDIKMPTTWNELTRQQLIKICGLYPQAIELSEFLSLAVFHLTGLKLVDRLSKDTVHQFKYNGKPVVMDTFTFATFCNSAMFLVEKPTLTLQKIPFIRILGFKYIGPSDMLWNMTFGEWLQVDIYMQHYSRTKERKYLQLAVACMYRREDKKKQRSNSYDGDPRRAFNEYLVEKQSLKFKWVPMDTLRAVSIFFSGSMEALKEKFPLTLHESTGEVGRDLLKDTLSMIDQLNNDDVTKNEAIQRTRLYDVLAKLEMTRERAKLLSKKQ